MCHLFINKSLIYLLLRHPRIVSRHFHEGDFSIIKGGEEMEELDFQQPVVVFRQRQHRSQQHEGCFRSLVKQGRVMMAPYKSAVKRLPRFVATVGCRRLQRCRIASNKPTPYHRNFSPTSQPLQPSWVFLPEFHGASPSSVHTTH